MNHDYAQEPPSPYEPQAPVLSLGHWVGVLILTAIPLVNLICLLVWAFSSGTNPNKKNYARASLLLGVIIIAIYILIFIAALLSGEDLSS